MAFLMLILALATSVATCTNTDRATLKIEVIPPDGQVWLDDHPVNLRQGKTELRTPPLCQGRTYQYLVRARWDDIEYERIVRFEPGQTVHLVLDRDDISTAPVTEIDGTLNFGIESSRLNGAAEHIMFGDRSLTHAEAVRLLQGGDLVDDRNKLRLTIIGSDADRRRVLDDLNGELKDIADQCLVQDYPPDHWAVTGAGFYTGGHPTIYVQQSDGTVLHRQDDYDDGAAGLRKAFECLRKPDPNYQPDKDRDLRRSGDGFFSRLLYILTYPFRVVLSWLAAAAVIAILIMLIMRGWLFYLLGLLFNILPTPPKTTTVSKRQPSSQRTKRTTRAKKGR